MLKLKQSPFIAGLIALAVILSLFGAFAHHHDAGYPQHECAACRLVQTLCVTLLFVAAVLLIQLLQNRPFVFVSEKSFHSHLGSSSLKDRAPPANFSL